MSLSLLSKVIAISLTAATLLGTASEAFASKSYYRRGGSNSSGELRYGYRHHGYYRGGGVGPAVAGAALGIIGGAAAGIAADRYYNGYPAYSYGPGYGGYYGYDYLPDHGYYGPY